MFTVSSLRIPPPFPLCTGTRIPEQNGQGLRRLYTVFRHTQRLPHTWILREAHREKERDQEARYRHKGTETSTHPGRGWHSKRPAHTQRQRDSYRKKGKQRCGKTPLDKDRTGKRSESEEAILSVQLPYTVLFHTG